MRTFFLSSLLASHLSSGGFLANASDEEQQEHAPLQSLTPMRIRGGVLLAPPFAMIDEHESAADASADVSEANPGEVRYTGFQGDLLRRLTTFAVDDGYDLQFELSFSPQNYGAALDVIANDCNTTSNPLPLEQCNSYDLVVGDYYGNAARSLRIDFTPPWLRSSMSAIKLIEREEGKPEYITLAQLQGAGGTACVPAGAYLSLVTKGKFPTLNYIDCPSPDECVARLRSRDCALYVDDELALKYRALLDPTLEVTGETFNTQYVVWPMSYDLSAHKRTMIKKWLYSAGSNATLDELFYTYFSVKICDLGTSGQECKRYCDPKRGRANRAGTCVCHSTKWTGGDCSIEVQEELNLYPAWLQALCYSLFGIQVAVCSMCSLWLYWKRKTRQVEAAQPFFLYLILFGCLVSTSSLLAAAQQHSGEGDSKIDVACSIFPWLFSVGFSITFGSLFAKIWRVYRLFKAAVEFQRVTITIRNTLSIVIVITLVDVIICTIWTVVDPLRWTRVTTRQDKFGEPLESQGFCYSVHWKAFAYTIAGWHIVLLALACMICYLTRNIPSKFSEGKSLAAAMVSNLQIIVVSVPVLIIVGGEPMPSLFVRAAVIWLNDFVVVAIIFGRLMRSVHDQNHGSNNLTVGDAVSQFREGYMPSQFVRKGSKQSIVNKRSVVVNGPLNNMLSQPESSISNDGLKLGASDNSENMDSSDAKANRALFRRGSVRFRDDSGGEDNKIIEEEKKNEINEAIITD